MCYGGKRVRTADPLRARQVLSQLSYTPSSLNPTFKILNFYNLEFNIVVGLGRVELPTSRLSGVRSNQLSYRPTLTLTYSSSLLVYEIGRRRVI